MENPSYKNDLLHIDFGVQIFLVVGNTGVLFWFVFGYLFFEKIWDSYILVLFVLQFWIGIMQFICSASTRAWNYFEQLDKHRKLHFFGSIGLITSCVIFLPLFAIINSFENNYIAWIINSIHLLILPQILMYYYFWITWRDWRDYKSNQ